MNGAEDPRTTIPSEAMFYCGKREER